METVEAGVLLLDDERVLVAVNESAAMLLGTPREELLGRRADEFMPVVARPLYPLAWRAFLLRAQAAGEYAAQRPDGSLAHLAYIGFANRPLRGLHFFVLERRAGELSPEELRPRLQGGHIQVGLDLPADVRERMTLEADRQEWQLPIRRDGERSILAALFEAPEPALDALESVRRLGEASIASAAGASPGSSPTLVAGRFPYPLLGNVVSTLRRHGGRIITHVDERWA